MEIPRLSESRWIVFVDWMILAISIWFQDAMRIEISRFPYCLSLLPCEDHVQRCFQSDFRCQSAIGCSSLGSPGNVLDYRDRPVHNHGRQPDAY